MKDAYYFSHDSNARNDTKILSMRCDYGLAGYGMYWIIVETLRDEADYKLMLDKSTYRALAMQMHSTITDVEKFIKDCINEYGLFRSDDQYFWADTLLRRMEKLENIREKRKRAAEKRWKQREDANAMQMHNKSNADEMQRDAKESKVKESKDIYIVHFENLWGLYPNKVGKGKISDTKKKELYKLGDEMERCISRYIKHVEERRKDGFSELKYQNGSTFFNSGYVDYLDKNYQEKEVKNTRGPLKLVIRDDVL